MNVYHTLCEVISMEGLCLAVAMFLTL